MKKFIFIILFLIFLPFKVYADGTNTYYVDVTINEDGSATFKEMIEFDGYYNYLERNLYLSGNNIKFDGNNYSSFYKTDIYNGTSITNICASSTNVNNSFDYVINHNNCFEKTDNGYKGLRRKYTITQNNQDYNIKIYNPSDLNEAFYLEYTITDAVVVHNDVAELLYNFEWSELINDYQVYIHLPRVSNTLRIFSHGPLQGENKIIDNKTAYVYWNYLNGDTNTDIRIVFDKKLVPNGTKKSNVEAFDKIIEFETKQANIQNELREEYKQDIINNAKYYTDVAINNPNRNNYDTAYYYVNLLEGELKDSLSLKLESVYEKVLFKENNLKIAFISITIAWLIGLCIIVYRFYKKYDKEYKSLYNNAYLRELPTTYGPEILGFLLTKNNIKSEYLSASIMEIIRKKSLKLDYDYSNNKQFKIINNKDKQIDNNLTSSERILKDWFINEVGNGEYVTNDDIKAASKKNYDSFLKSYNNWKNDVISEGNNMKFYEDNSGKKVIYCLYCILGIIIYFISTSISSLSFTIIIVPIAIISLIYIITASKRTTKGNDDYVKWLSFKKFLLDFGRFKEKELPEIYLWEHFLVYATAFGIADKVEKAMNMKIQEYNLNTTDSYIPIFYGRNIILSNMLNDSITKSITSAQSAYSAAHSSSSSGGGFGGGASFGGGGGGFGGGGGRG